MKRLQPSKGNRLWTFGGLEVEPPLCCGLRSHFCLTIFCGLSKAGFARLSRASAANGPEHFRRFVANLGNHFGGTLSDGVERGQNKRRSVCHFTILAVSFPGMCPVLVIFGRPE